MAESAPLDSAKNDSKNGKGGDKTPVKRQRTLGALAARPGLDEMVKFNLTLNVSPKPSTWMEIPNGSLFSASSDGSQLYLKVSRSKCIYIKTGESKSCDSGSYYQVYF